MKLKIQNRGFVHKNWGKLDLYTLSSVGGALWLFLSLNPCVLWITPRWPWFLLAFGLVFFVTLQFFLRGELPVTYRKLWIFFFVFFLCFGFAVSGLLSLVDTFKFISLLGLVLWNNKATYGLYKYFKYIILFFSVCALINFVFLLMGITIPYFSFVAEDNPVYKDTLFRIHGGLTVTTPGESLNKFVRVRGPLFEGGHFGIILGVIFIIDKLLGQKMDKIILITGLLTFSPAFLVLFLSVCFYNFFFSRNKRKILSYAFFSILFILFVFFLLPEDVQEKITYTFYGRNLQTVVEVGMEEQSLEMALSKRANKAGNSSFNQFEKADISTKFWGMGNLMDKSVVMSDYRAILFKTGYAGLSAVLLLGLACSFSKRKKIMIMMLIPFLLVLAHRAWMLDTAVYIYYLCFCGGAVYTYRRETKQYCSFTILKGTVPS